MDHIIRPATQDDAGFVIETWLRSYRSSAWASRIPGDVYWSRYGHMGFVEDMVRGGRAVVLVACLPSDRSFMYGWSAWAPQGQSDTLHFVYVKDDWRGKGIGKVLARLPAGPGLKVTAHTLPWRKFAQKHGINWEFKHPYREERTR